MPKQAIEYLRHIKDECDFVISSVDILKTKEDFITDEILKRAVVRSLEIIGEATKKIPADIKVKWSEITWKNMAGMRDRLIHDYMGINYNIVWDVAKNKIPELLEQITQVIDKEEQTTGNKI